MNNTVIYVILFMVIIYAAFFFFSYQRRKKLKDVFQNLDLQQEALQADVYKDNLLAKDFGFIQEQLSGEPIEAFTYANAQYTGKDQAKDVAKDALKGIATLGTVRFTTVQTPKYLILSQGAVHLLDTDTEGEVSKHLIFDASRMQNARIEEKALSTMAKAQAKFAGFELKSYSLHLPTDGDDVVLELYSTLMFNQATTGGNMMTMSSQRQVENFVIANQFLYKLGVKYPQLRVQTTVPF
ncbi:hypothetical protein DBR32_05455 [Taibaiella sp. KBW10]|uniref:hypothetical protein n=1 Tax=Taibaiella sp. KBW10 TaxID=2153357 RepID=UPI000F5978C0|nr:hypothetical protein [Taibaiella sp. KBW10]RQO31410.1 hypothetical protein DBR32_05455 [Taibaiella sp. KBW10]